MAIRIKRPDTAFNGSTKSKPVKNADYLDFIRSLPCVVTGQRPVEAAHVSFVNLKAGSTGRGKSQKVSDAFALPMHPDQHRRQHGMNEEAFWAQTGIDPHYVALALHRAWSDGTPELAQVILMAHFRP